MSVLPPPVTLKYKVANTENTAKPATPAPVRPPVHHGRKFKEKLFRIGIVVVILFSLALAYWSFFHHLVPLQKESATMLARVTSSSSSLDELIRRWTPEQAEQIRTDYAKVYSELFSDQSQLEQWLGQVQAQASPLSLQIGVELGEGKPQQGFAESVMVVPASISLEVRPLADDPDGKSPYGRVLAFGQALSQHGKRADLAELNVSGGVGSVNRAVMVFNLWAGDLGSDAALTPEAKEAK